MGNRLAAAPAEVELQAVEAAEIAPPMAAAAAAEQALEQPQRPQQRMHLLNDKGKRGL